MEPGSEVFVAADSRRWLRALRPVLLLGGFVVMWWLLAIGSAQAADGPGHGLDVTTKALNSTVDHLVAPKPAPQPASKPAPELAPVVETVVETVVKTVVKTVHSLVEPVVAEVTKTVRATPAGAVVASEGKSPEHAGHPHAGSAQSSTRHDETAKTHLSPKHTAKAAAQTVLTPARTVPVVAAPALSRVKEVDHQAVRMTPSSPPGSPLQPAPDNQPLATTASSAASSVQSGSGSAPTAGLCEGTHLFVPPTTATVVPGSADRLDAGPAYRPSCSPD